MPKLSRDAKNKLLSKTAREQFAQDHKVWQAYYDDVGVAKPSQGKEIIQRLMLATMQGGLLIRKPNDTEFKEVSLLNQRIKDPKEQVSVVNMLSHGGRISFEIPPLKEGQNPHEFFSWIMTGSPEYKSIKHIKNHQPSLISRLFASHGSKSLSEQERQEISVSPLNFPGMVSGAVRKVHYGVNLGIESETKAGPEDGTRGHLYVYYKPPTADKPGVFLAGIEGSQDLKYDQYGHFHGPTATSSKFSFTGGLKWLSNKLKDHPCSPDNLDGSKVRLDQNTLQALYKTDIKKFDIKKFFQPISREKPLNQLMSKATNTATSTPASSTARTFHTLGFGPAVIKQLTQKLEERSKASNSQKEKINAIPVPEPSPLSVPPSRSQEKETTKSQNEKQTPTSFFRNRMPH